MILDDLGNINSSMLSWNGDLGIYVSYTSISGWIDRIHGVSYFTKYELSRPFMKTLAMIVLLCFRLFLIY